MNYARDRIDNDIKPTFPSKDIVCKTCRFKKPGVIGYRNSYCGVYVDYGKPDEVLFENQKCEYYEAEK